MEKQAELILEDMVEMIACVSRDKLLQSLIIAKQKSLPILEHNLIGTNFLDLLPTDFAPIIKTAIEKAHKNDQSQSFVHHLKYGETLRDFEIKVSEIDSGNILVIIRDITEQKQTELELLKLYRSLLSLQTASTSVMASLDLEYVLETFAWELSNLLKASGCLISQWDNDADKMSILSTFPQRNFWRTHSENGTYSLSQYPLTKQILLERFSHQIIFNEVNSDLPELADMKRANISSLLMLPLVFQNQTVGLVEVIGEQEQIFSNQQISLAQLLTNEAASAFVNARLYRQLNHHLKEISTLNGISQAATSTLDLTEILTLVTKGTLDLVGAEAVSLAFLDDDKEHFWFATATGGAASFIKNQRLSLNDGISGWVIKHGKYALIQDIKSDSRHHPFFDEKSGFQSRSILCVPLQVKEQTIGAISALNKLTGEFNNEDLRLLTSLAMPAATAIENAQLYERTLLEVAERQRAEIALEQERASLAQRVEKRTTELRHQYQRQQALATIKPTMNHSDDLKTILKQIVTVAEVALPADGGAKVILWDKESKQLIHDINSNKIPSGIFIETNWWDGEMSRLILENNQIVVVSDISVGSFGINGWLRISGYHSYVGVPLIEQGACFGIIYVFSWISRNYTQEDLDFLSDLASRAAVMITNLQLYQTIQQTNTELARAARMKDEFLASMSHELRTPLSVILSITEGLQEQFYGTLNEKQQQFVQIVQESGDHLLALINDILDVAKVESGEFVLDIQPTSVIDICNSSLKFIRRASIKKGISVHLEIDSSVGIIFVDARRLKQILINLLNNAVKFTPDGGKIGLTVSKDLEANMLNFTVWDTGIGIQEEKKEKLFQPFVQLDSSLSRRYAGTGLGLALVKRMTEMHGGHIVLESEVGKGSKFTVVLPLHSRRADSPISQSMNQQVNKLAKSENMDQPNKIGSQLILVVDDDETNSNILSELLVLSGYQVKTANSGKEALKLFKDEQPNIILMDIQMPDIDGLETIRRIRSMPGGASVLIIALTALSMNGDYERCLEAGADKYLSKPAPFQKIIDSFQYEGKGDAAANTHL